MVAAAYESDLVELMKEGNDYDKQKNNSGT